MCADGSSRVDGLTGYSTVINAPGTNQTFNDCIWRDVQYYTIVKIHETDFTPEEALPDLSIDFTIQNSLFQDGRYERSVVYTSKQNLTVSDTRFLNMNSVPCTCNNSNPTLIYCGTLGVDDEDPESYGDSYCTVRNNCFAFNSDDYAYVVVSSFGEQNAFATIENNFVTSSNVGFLVDSPNEGFCELHTRRDNEQVGCDQMGVAESCAVDLGPTGPCPHPFKHCVEKQLLEECYDLLEGGCQDITYTRSCPEQYICGDDDIIFPFDDVGLEPSTTDVEPDDEEESINGGGPDGSSAMELSHSIVSLLVIQLCAAVFYAVFSL